MKTMSMSQTLLMMVMISKCALLLLLGKVEVIFVSHVKENCLNFETVTESYCYYLFSLVVPLVNVLH